MKYTRRLQSLAMALTLGMISGCAWYPIANKYVHEAAPGLTVPMVQADAKKYTGAIVIWGGIVLNVTNDSLGSTLFVMETPLDDEGYPSSANLPRGRFIAHTPLFLDPEIYRKGRRVTLAGEITGVSTRKLGEGTYAYPILKVKELRYWQYYSNYYSPYGPYYDPYNGPWWYDDFGVRYYFGFDERGHYYKHRGYYEHRR